MTTRPNQPASDEADRDKEPTPGGVARDLERKADELDAEVEPDDLQAADLKPAAGNDRPDR